MSQSCQLVCLPVYLLVSLFVHFLFVCLSVYLSVCLLVCLFVVCLSVVCLFVCCMSVYGLFVCLFLLVCIFVAWSCAVDIVLLVVSTSISYFQELLTRQERTLESVTQEVTSLQVALSYILSITTQQDCSLCMYHSYYSVELQMVLRSTLSRN